MCEMIKMYDYLMSEYNKTVAIEDFGEDEIDIAYANMCWTIAQAYLEKIKNEY